MRAARGRARAARVPGRGGRAVERPRGDTRVLALIPKPASAMGARRRTGASTRSRRCSGVSLSALNLAACSNWAMKRTKRAVGAVGRALVTRCRAARRCARREPPWTYRSRACPRIRTICLHSFQARRWHSSRKLISFSRLMRSANLVRWISRLEAARKPICPRPPTLRPARQYPDPEPAKVTQTEQITEQRRVEERTSIVPGSASAPGLRFGDLPDQGVAPATHLAAEVADVPPPQLQYQCGPRAPLGRAAPERRNSGNDIELSPHGPLARPRARGIPK